MNLNKFLLCAFLSVMSLNGFAQEEEFLSGKGPDSEFVYSLHLWDKGLKEIPDNFASWTELEVVFLDGNELKSLPPSITKLSKLRELSISGNQLTSFPKEILELKNIKTLDIHGNKILTIPDEIGKLSQLEYLLISDTGIKTLPESICQLKNLELLAVSGNELKTLPACLKDLSKLEYLYVGENSFESFPSIISELTHLKSLSVEQKNQYEIPTEIKNLKNLEMLYVDKDYYKKNKSKIDKLLPKNCQVNPLPPPPPTIEPVEFIEPEEINQVGANHYCFNFTEKVKKGDIVTKSNYILEFGDYSDNARLIKQSSEYDEKKNLEAEKNGETIVSNIIHEFSDGVYEKKDGNLIYIPENAEKQTFKITYDNDKTKIKELKDAKKQVWKKGECYAAPPSMGF